MGTAAGVAMRGDRLKGPDVDVDADSGRTRPNPVRHRPARNETPAMNPAPLPTMLVVGSDEATVDALSAAGNDVIRCPGPLGSTCPMVVGTGCALVDGAAGIVFGLDLDDDHHREILRCYREHKGPAFPVRVIAGSDQQVRHESVLTGVRATETLDQTAIAEFSGRVALADMARRALMDLVAPHDPGGRSSLRAAGIWNA